MQFERQLNLQEIKGSLFLFGPRMTGKTYLIRSLPCSLYIDLLISEKELEFKQAPGLLWEQLAVLKKNDLVIIDEIQKVPALLNYVQKGIEELGLRFILSGSSARKLKRGGANLLGGRALDFKLHALSAHEIGTHFNIDHALQYGTLPKITQTVLENDLLQVRRLLQAYYTTYIKEEIQAEALTRNIGSFQRFLKVAAQSNGQVIEYANLSRECQIPASTIKEYFSILEDTLLGRYLWPWDRSERKKARPKFYLFDCGVVRSIQNQLQDPPTAHEKGFLFETWFIQECVRIRDYEEKNNEFGFWRNGPHEIDLLITKAGKPVLGIECKTGRDFISEATAAAFQQQFPGVPLIVASLQDQYARKQSEHYTILPWQDALNHYRNL